MLINAGCQIFFMEANMALSTLITNDVHCDWCGRWMKKTSGTWLDDAGFGLLAAAGAAATKHYCSKACKIAAKQAAAEQKAEKLEAKQAKRVAKEAKLAAKQAELDSMNAGSDAVNVQSSYTSSTINQVSEKKEIKTVSDFTNAFLSNDYSDRDLIENFIVPNEKDEIMDYLLFSSDKIKTSAEDEIKEWTRNADKSDKSAGSYEYDSYYCFNIWKKSISTTITKAKIKFSDDTAFMGFVNTKEAELNDLVNSTETMRLQCMERGTKGTGIEAIKRNMGNQVKETLGGVFGKLPFAKK